MIILHSYEGRPHHTEHTPTLDEYDESPYPDVVDTAAIPRPYSFFGGYEPSFPSAHADPEWLDLGLIWGGDA